ncbi:hypothetical protein G1C97_1044 [Bifidobacterium sp. DSM 109959]|uniref:Uncharacterized protein n=1 Tax=Bifidobacterium olomucense TaxID=2675324 RepID=A0A7Y0EX87_9BIFI|nr:hypothetical protein [Bifidobacterium sp. DSM 109959]
MTFSRKKDCMCDRCNNGGGAGVCPDCGRTDCAKALSHTFMCNKLAAEKHRMKRRII